MRPVRSSRAEDKVGAGGNDSDCTPADMIAGKGDDDLKVGNGGCGGAFGTTGGTGGRGGSNGQAQVGLCDTRPPISIDRLRGGCRGGDGGFETAPPELPPLVYLIAGVSIEVHGLINASGGGARPAVVNGLTLPGGGGGGSGGMIAFDAPKLDLEGARLFALGGGGGSGSGEASGLRDGNPGIEADLENGNPPMGSNQTVNINPGGASPFPGNGSPGGDVANDKRGGGGGGGGGHGVVLVFPPTLIPTGTYTAKPDFPPLPI